MKQINVGIIGFGTIGKGVVKTLLSKRNILEKRTGVSVNIAKIADKDLRPRPGIRLAKGILTSDVNSVIKDKNIDVIVELIGGIHPAKEIILKALSLGKRVVTANKALLGEYGREIFTAASRFGTSVGFEGSVGGGIPIINALARSLVPNDIELIYGILNGTSNFILTRMSDENHDFRSALKEARTKGIAERKPKLDVSGVDSCNKLAILALLGFGLNVKPKDIYVEGIEEIDPIDVQYAKNWGYAVKLLAIGKKVGKELDLRVHPTLISLEKLLANVKDENNAIFIKGDMVGETLFYGKGAGSFPTASSVISDIIDFAETPKLEFNAGIKSIRKITDLNTRYYLRFSAIDRPGVLAGISGVLAQNRISIATVTQKERKKGQPVPIVMLTHEANEGAMNRAMDRINRLPFIKRNTVKIRIEG